MVVIAVFAVAALVTLALVAWAGTRMLRSDAPRTSSMADGLGNFIDVFDPARARADEDLRSRKATGEVLPSPDGDEAHPVWKVDLHHNVVRIPRPH